MKTQQNRASDNEHRVLQFRPRGSVARANPRGQTTSPEVLPEDLPLGPHDLSRYQRSPVERDDFRQRMLANFAAVAFTIALTAVGILLAKNIADFRNTQDCLLAGRPDCVRIYVPDP